MPIAFKRVRVLLAEQPAPPFDDLFLELPGRDQPPLRPQAVGEVEHGSERFGVILSKGPALLGYYSSPAPRSCCHSFSSLISIEIFGQSGADRLRQHRHMPVIRVIETGDHLSARGLEPGDLVAR